MKTKHVKKHLDDILTTIGWALVQINFGIEDLPEDRILDTLTDEQLLNKGLNESEIFIMRLRVILEQAHSKTLNLICNLENNK